MTNTPQQIVKTALDKCEDEMPHFDAERSPNDYLASAAIEALRKLAMERTDIDSYSIDAILGVPTEGEK